MRAAVCVGVPVALLQFGGVAHARWAQALGAAALGVSDHVRRAEEIVGLVLGVVEVGGAARLLGGRLVDVEESSGLLGRPLRLGLRLRGPAGTACLLRFQDLQAGAVRAGQVACHLPAHQVDDLVADLAIVHRGRGLGPLGAYGVELVRHLVRGQGDGVAVLRSGSGSSTLVSESRSLDSGASGCGVVLGSGRRRARASRTSSSER